MEFFNPIKICNIGDQNELFYYVGTDNDGNIIEDDLDNGLEHKVVGKEIKISFIKNEGGNIKEVLDLKDVEIEMIVTDCRVIFRCDKFVKGDRWIGGISASILNGIERVTEHYKNKGKILAGHIRYDWLGHIAYILKKKNSLFDNSYNKIKICFIDYLKNTVCFEVYFDMNINTEFIANEILHKTCKYRLMMQDEKKEEFTEFLKNFSENKIIENIDKTKYSSISLLDTYLAPIGGIKNRPKM